MEKIAVGFLLALLSLMPGGVLAEDIKSREKSVYQELKSHISADRIKTPDDLYRKWQEVQAGRSNAVLIDLRTEAEFASGHIKDSNNVDSGHAYTMPDRWPDPETEMWVYCRTTHRATYFVGTLYKYGYKNVYLVEKGIVGWAEKAYPLFNTYLGEIKVVKYDKKLMEKYAFRENR
jgi:rhodanese-related sulfurtransferase